ncbi:MAG: MSHA biogenesis protein MshI [Methylotenera sp.]|nr:MSHA biogenesis protein MshI [Methylotenera sp.]
MSQQINLINHSLIKQQAFLTFKRAVLITLGLMLILALYTTYAESNLTRLTAQRQQLASDLSQAQTQLAGLAAMHKPHEANPLLMLEIDQLTEKLNLQQQVLATINKSANRPENSYAAIMRGFARQTTDGLWLTGFHLDSLSNQLSIQGATLKADLVPEYIVKLSTEPAFKGRLFSGLNIQQPQLNNQTHSQENPSNKASDVLDSQDTAVTSATPAYIEFSLISNHADSAQMATHANTPASNVVIQKAATGDRS